MYVLSSGSKEKNTQCREDKSVVSRCVHYSMSGYSGDEHFPLFCPDILYSPHSVPFLETRWVPRSVCGLFSPVEIDHGSSLEHSCYLKHLWTL